jgi:hypothetical protein
MFLGSQDIQLGVNESLLDSAKVISSMVDGIMARVGHHSEVEVSSASASGQGDALNLLSPDTGRTLDCSRHKCSIAPIPSITNTR